MSSTTEDNNDIDHQHGGGGDIMTSSKKEECTSCEQNNMDNITETFNSIAILGDTSTCASCGKEGNSDNMNTCNKCKMVRYCNAACKKKHRSKHKKKCERRVAELHDEQLFKDPPPHEECPICFLPFLGEDDSETFKSCCGKIICNGCIYAMKLSEGKDLCAYCRMPPPSSAEEHIKRAKKLMGKGDGDAFDMFAGWYAEGNNGLPQDLQKARELFLKAGELGCASGYYNLGVHYDQGRGVEVDKKKAQHYYELAAMSGDIYARHNLGCLEHKAGNYDRAITHLIIAAKEGDTTSLGVIKTIFMTGLISKDEYTSTLRAYHDRQKEMKSDARDKAAQIRAVAAQIQG